MGQLFKQGGLTQPDSALLNANNSAAMVGDPSKMRDIDFRTHSQLHPYVPGTPDPNQPLPSVGTPTFQQAATAGATPGGANVLSPGLNKAGKLVTLLTSGLQGALAGRAASEQTVAATGGHRSGGAGMGFEAGYTLPWQRQAQQNQLAQQQAQIEATRAQSQIIQTPAGPMPAWLAKSILPAEIHKEGTLGAAQTGKEGRLGAADITGQYRMKALAAGTAPITQEDIQQYGLPPEFLGKVIKPSEIGGLQRAQNSNLTTVQGAQGPALVNKGKGTAKDLGLGSPGVAARLAGGVQVGDPNNPGETTFTTMGNAIKTGAKGPQSASVQAPRAVLKSATSGKIGEEINAFNTALQHADLLKSAVMALGNGDQDTLNSLKNRFKAEFGVSGPVSAQVIADAYTREINKMLSAGHITDAEIGAIGKTLNVTRQSSQQALGALDAYRALATSKMNMRRQQVEQGMKGKANFPKPADATHIVPGPDGKNHYTNAQGTVDLGLAP